MFSQPLSDQEVWANLPLSPQQRKEIYEDFILTNKYDKKDDDLIKEREMKEIKKDDDDEKTK